MRLLSLQLVGEGDEPDSVDDHGLPDLAVKVAMADWDRSAYSHDCSEFGDAALQAL
jgi:hypothetical protein